MSIYSKVYFGLLFITMVSYLILFRRKELYVKMVISLMGVWFLTTAVAICLIRYAGFKNNLFVFHVSTPLEYIVLVLLYKNVIVNQKVKKYILLSIPFFIAVSILFAIFVQTPDTNNTQIIIIESVFMVFLSLFFLREVLLLQQVTELHRFPMFWISVGILFYFIGNLVIEGMLNYLINHSMDLAKKAYRIGYIFKYLLFILFIIGALCNTRSRFYLQENK